MLVIHARNGYDEEVISTVSHGMGKGFIMGGMIVGSLIGGYIPMLWGESAFSLSGIVWNAIGGFSGIYVAYKISNRYF